MPTGDIRTILSMDYSQYQAGAAAGVSANRDFAKSADQLYNSIAAVQKSMDQARKFQVGTVEFGMSKQLHQNNAAADVQFQAANNRMSNELLNDAYMASQRLAGSYERLKSATLELSIANQTLSASATHAEHATARQEHTYQNVVNFILKERQAADNAMLTQNALNDAFANGTITAAEYKQAMASLTGATNQQAKAASAADNAVKSMVDRMRAAKDAIGQGNYLAGPGLNQNVRVNRAESQGNLSGLQASNALNSAVLSDQSSQHLRLATAIEQERSAALSAQGALQLLANQEKSAAFQAESARASHSRLTLAIHQDRQATRLLAETKRLLEGDLKKGIITAKEYKQALASMTTGQAMMARGSGRTQLAISQMIFAVDDAATVYGTAGLSGAIRAASNNLTMMAGLMGGPWALGAAVAIAATVQLGMVLFKSSDGAKAAKDSLNDMTAALDRQSKAIADRLGLERELVKLRKEGDVEESAKSIEDLRNRQKELDEERKLLLEQANSKQGDMNPEKRTWGKFFFEDVGPAWRAYWGDESGQKKKATEEFNAINKRLAEVTTERAQGEREIQQRLENQAKIMKEQYELAKRSVQENLQGFLSGFRQQSWEANAKHRQKAAENATRAVDMETSISDQLDPTGNASRKRQIAMEFKEREKFFRQNIGDDDQRRSSISQARAAALKQLEDLDRVNDPHAGEGPSAVEKGSKEAAESQRQAILSSMRRDNGGQKTHEQTLENLLKQINDNSRKQKELTQKMVQAAPTPAGVNP